MWGNAVVVPTFLRMFFVNVYPVTPADKSAPQKRHAPKSELAIAVLKDIYPPDRLSVPTRPSRIPSSSAHITQNATAAIFTRTTASSTPSCCAALAARSHSPA